MELSGRRFLITGATGVLGSSIATRLADRGVSLSLVGRREDRLAELASLGHILSRDLRDPGACADAVDAAIEALGGLDGVVNALGVVAFGPVDELSSDVVEELFMTNTFAPMMVAAAALPHIERGGVVAGITGVVAEQAFGGLAAYGASKAALRSFHQALAAEARRRRIRVLDIRPPHTETGLADRAIVGTAPRMPTGLSPDAVADRIVAALEADEPDLPSTAFAG